jgi:hypothetical protein
MRTQEREHAHVASTLDNLINMASQDCTRKKRAKLAAPRTEKEEAPSQAATVTAVEAPKPSGDRSFEVRLVSLEEDDPARPVAVTLSIGGVDGTGAAMPAGRSLMDAVAQAAARAVERIQPGVALEITATVIDTGSDGEKVVTVVGSIAFQGRVYAMAGTRPVSRDVHRAVAEAVAAGFVSVPLS